MNSALERTRATRPTLRKSEGKVADLVLSDPARILESSLAGVAELAGVSQPTVIRFCVAAGYSGFQEFRLRLAQSLALGRSATHSVISDRDGLSAVTDKIFEYTLTSLDWARRHLDRALDRLFRLWRLRHRGDGRPAEISALRRSEPRRGRRAPADHGGVHDAAWRRAGRHLQHRADPADRRGGGDRGGAQAQPSSAWWAPRGRSARSQT